MDEINYLNETENPYPRLLMFLPGENHEVAETKYPYLHLTERHLQAMWLEQKYFKNLATSEGLPVEVISPGIWNCEAGPDFLKGHFRIGAQEVKGDVEIHLSDDGWNRHQHHLDPRYQDVVLHISLWKPKHPSRLCTVNEKSFHQAYFEDHLTIPLNRILGLIDLDLFPYKKFIGSGKCAQDLFCKENEKRLTTFFQSAADWRLSQKRELLKSKVGDYRYLAGAGIAMALGYKENAEPFFELLIHLLKFRQCAEAELLAIGLGISGYFEEHFQKKWKGSDKYASLSKIFEQYSMPRLIYFAGGKTRPLNHPVRRLAYLSKLLADPALASLEGSFYSLWEASWKDFAKKRGSKVFLKKFLDLIPSYEDPYWNYHYTFEDEKRNEYLPLLGENVRMEIFVNTFLPLIHEPVMKRGDREEIHAFHQLYRSVPASKSGKMRYLSHRFFGDNPKGKLLNKACFEQGAFQLHHDFCTHYESSCEGCHFVERYRSQFV